MYDIKVFIDGPDVVASTAAGREIDSGLARDADLAIAQAVFDYALARKRTRIVFSSDQFNFDGDLVIKTQAIDPITESLSVSGLDSRASWNFSSGGVVLRNVPGSSALDFSLENIRVQGPGSGTGLRVDAASIGLPSDGKYSNLAIIGFATGIDFSGDANPAHVPYANYFSNVHVRDCAKGIRLGGCHNYLENCKVYSPDGSPTVGFELVAKGNSQGSNTLINCDGGGCDTGFALYSRKNLIMNPYHEGSDGSILASIEGGYGNVIESPRGIRPIRIGISSATVDTTIKLASTHETGGNPTSPEIVIGPLAYGVNVESDGCYRDARIVNSGSVTKTIKQFDGTDIPKGGRHRAGDICWNRAPAYGKPVGWVCMVAGSPGTWVAMGILTGG